MSQLREPLFLLSSVRVQEPQGEVFRQFRNLGMENACVIDITSLTNRHTNIHGFFKNPTRTGVADQHFSSS